MISSLKIICSSSFFIFCLHDYQNSCFSFCRVYIIIYNLSFTIWKLFSQGYRLFSYRKSVCIIYLKKNINLLWIIQYQKYVCDITAISISIKCTFTQQFSVSFKKHNHPSTKTMLQDKIQHNLIKINQLTTQKQPIRYIIPLYFNAIKHIHENSLHYKIDPYLIEEVANRYKFFEEEYRNSQTHLDQVHVYMFEECNQMIQNKQFHGKSEVRRNKIFSRLKENQENIKEEQIIVLQQEQYRFNDNFEIEWETPRSSDSELQIKKSNIIRPISLDGIPNFDHQNHDFTSIWEKLQNSYKNHRLDEAFSLCQSFQNALFLYDPNSKLNQQKYGLIERIHQQHKQMTHYYQYFNEPNYTFDKTEKGVSMYYKINQETKEVSVRVEAQLNIPVQNFLCIASQVDLFSEFVPFAYDTKTLCNPNRNQTIGLTRAYIPLLSNRQAYFFAVAYDRLKTHKSIFMYSKTISSDVEFQRKMGLNLQKDKELVQLQYKFYILQYIPIAPNKGKVRLATNIDMKLSFLPMFIINASLRKFSFDYFKNMLKVNKNFKDSEWQKKMLANPHKYIFFKQRIGQYLASQSIIL